MSALQANCPSCGGAVEFKSGSTVVVVCRFCRSVVARTDRALEDLGKVAEIVETESPLKTGLRGKYSNNNFELTGRAQLRHEAGGIWDEWYATFSNGWVGWLAEAQGRFYLTFYQPLPPGAEVPNFGDLQIGAPVPLNLGSSSRFVVAEKGTATAVAAEGEIPYQLTPNETSYYADLSGAGGAFATIDYGTNPPFVFVGREVTLAEIGLSAARPAEKKARAVSAAKLGCPNCGGPLDLRAPDAAERVTCPNCDSLLDVNQGNLRYLRKLKPEPVQYALPIGAVGNFAGREPMQIIGAVTRSVVVEGEKYFWQEYLLYNPKIGFRWLVQSDNHWSFVESIAAGDVSINSATPTARGATVTYQGDGAAKGKTFKIFQHAWGEVEHVRGEFYWRVETGERALMTDYVNAPFALSREVTAGDKSGEVNWSLGTYVPVADVEKAFNVQNLPRPFNVAPNQPFPHKDLYKYGFALLGLLIVVGIFLLPFTSGGQTVKAQNFVLPPMANPQAAQIVFSEPFELKGNRNVEITAVAPQVSNSWLDADVDLVNEQNNEIESVPINVEFYSGTDSDGAWTEGGTSNSAILSSVPAGKYTLRIEGSWGNWQQPQPVSVTVKQNAFRGVNFCCAFVLIGALPLLVFVWSLTFESRRWSESMFAPVSSDSSDD